MMRHLRGRLRAMMTRPSDFPFWLGIGVCLGAAVLLVLEALKGWFAG